MSDVQDVVLLNTGKDLETIEQLFNIIKALPSFNECCKFAREGKTMYQFYLAIRLLFGLGTTRNVEMALSWLSYIARSGDAFVQWYLSEVYENENIISPSNGEEAKKWCEVSAKNGNANAQYKLGKWYENGIYVEKDSQKAVKWYQAAAIQKNSEACYYLARCYFAGRGVNRDVKAGYRWMFKAAQLNHAVAAQCVGHYYECGDEILIRIIMKLYSGFSAPSRWVTLEHKAISVAVTCMETAWSVIRNAH